MELKETLDKPYTEGQRIDFIVENNHQKGYEIRETEVALEAWGMDDSEALEYQQNQVRSVRNNYLVEYVDGAVSNPLRWADMSQELRDMYINYRQYLKDYTNQENWWEKNPLTLDEWKML